jgi:hypothetical protein
MKSLFKNELIFFAATGFIGLILLDVAVSLPYSNMTSKSRGAWFWGMYPNVTDQVPQYSSSGFKLLVLLSLGLGSLSLIFISWYRLINVAKTRNIKKKYLYLCLGLWSAIFLLMPPLASRDAYSYYADGLMVVRGMNPYKLGVSSLGYFPGRHLVDPLWINTICPYGPLYLYIAAFTVRAGFSNELAALEIQRALLLISAFVTAYSVIEISKALGLNQSVVFIITVLNPVSLLYLIGGIHNDYIMIGLVSMGLMFGVKNKPILSLLCCTLALLVKIPAIFMVFGSGYFLAPKTWPKFNRALYGTAFTAICLLLAGIVGIFTGFGLKFFTSSTIAASVWAWPTPTDVIGDIVSFFMRNLGSKIGLGQILKVSHLVGEVFIVFGLLAVVIYFLKDRINEIETIALAILITIFFAPVVQPWYITWAIVPLSLITKKSLNIVLVIASLIMLVLGLEDDRLMLDSVFHLGYLLPLLAIIIFLPSKLLFNFKLESVNNV